MNADATPAPSVKTFLLQAVLWLPLAFFLWFVLRSVVVALPVRAAGLALEAWLPDVVLATRQQYESLVYDVLASVAGSGLPGDRMEVTLQANALKYCYGLAVLVGLVMATPLTWARTFLQIGVGWLVMIPLQAFGLVGEVLKELHYGLAQAVASGLAGEGFVAESGPAGQQAAAVARQALDLHGVGIEVAGLWYQFGYLILPAIVPVVVWILFNRRFIEGFGVRLSPVREPAAPSRGP